jgi:hypothetical protein
MLSFDKKKSGTNPNVMVSFPLDIGTFVEPLLLYSFDITGPFSCLLPHLEC